MPGSVCKGFIVRAKHKKKCSNSALSVWTHVNCISWPQSSLDDNIIVVVFTKVLFSIMKFFCCSEEETI